LINTFDRNLKLSLKVISDETLSQTGLKLGKITDISSESISRTIVYSPFYGKVWETYSYKAPIDIQLSHVLMGTQVLRNKDLSKLIVEFDRARAFLGEKEIGKATAVKLGGIETDIAKLDYYAITGKGEGIKFYGYRKVITQKEASLPQTQSGTRVMDIPYESLPTDWKISLAMKTMFGEPKTQPQLQIQTIPQITLTKQPIWFKR
jgi:hypothetical protein